MFRGGGKDLSVPPVYTRRRKESSLVLYCRVKVVELACVNFF